MIQNLTVTIMYLKFKSYKYNPAIQVNQTLRM